MSLVVAHAGDLALVDPVRFVVDNVPPLFVLVDEVDNAAVAVSFKMTRVRDLVKQPSL